MLRNLSIAVAHEEWLGDRLDEEEREDEQTKSLAVNFLEKQVGREDSSEDDELRKRDDKSEQLLSDVMTSDRQN